MTKQLFLSLMILLITLPLFAFKSIENTRYVAAPQFALVDKSILTSGNLEIEDRRKMGTDIDNAEIKHYEAVIQNLKNLSDNMEMYEEATKTEKEDTMVDHDDASLFYDLGVSLNNAGMNRKAIGAYKKAIEINPNYIEAHYNLALSYLILNDTVAALKKYKLLKNLAPKMAENLYKQADFIASLNIFGGYVVQVGAYKTLDNANKIAEKLKSDYLYVYIDKLDNLNKVKILGINTKEEANLMIEEISKKFKFKPYLITEQ
jgi:tetratricopeptide (TPR) repeat protein